ncbi:hypothetical protein ACRRTK_021807 [Alexandromys fortis]
MAAEFYKQDFADLSTTTESVRDEILFKHLELRVLLDPPGSDLLKMDLSTTEKSVQEEIVNKHNELRGSVNPPGSDLLEMVRTHSWTLPLESYAWNLQIALGFMRHLLTAVKIVLALPRDLRCGENIFMASYPATWSQAIQSWYDESKDFKFGSGPTTPGAAIGHYTQEVLVHLSRSTLYGHRTLVFGKYFSVHTFKVVSNSVMVNLMSDQELTCYPGYPLAVYVHKPEGLEAASEKFHIIPSSSGVCRFFDSFHCAMKLPGLSPDICIFIILETLKDVKEQLL